MVSVARKSCFSLVGFSLILFSCGSEKSDLENESPTLSRSFYMGISTWPYDNTVESIDRLYEEVQKNAGLVDHHLQLGIPWQEAFDGSDYPTSVESEIELRLSRTDENANIYLSIDSLNATRDGLALSWTEDGGNQPRTGAWANRGFADQEVADAYIEFASDLINRFEPDYFNYAAEVSDLMRLDEDEFDDFVVFASRVYPELKERFPNLKVLVSLAIRSPESEDANTIRSNYPSIKDYTDMLGISIYPFVFFEHEDLGNPKKLPDNWLSQVQALDPNKSMAITETGWPAEDVEVPEFNLNISADESDQKKYVELLMEEADELSLEFVNWFSLVDYDELWDKALGDSVSLIWKDTGMIDENLNERPALQVWQDWLERPNSLP